MHTKYLEHLFLYLHVGQKKFELDILKRIIINYQLFIKKPGYKIISLFDFYIISPIENIKKQTKIRKDNTIIRILKNLLSLSSKFN